MSPIERACPFMGILFMTVTFCPNRLKFLMGDQETIIYRLVMRNLRNVPYFSILIFWVVSENGHGPHAGTKGSGTSKINQKMAYWVEILCHLLF